MNLIANEHCLLFADNNMHDRVPRTPSNCAANVKIRLHQPLLSVLVFSLNFLDYLDHIECTQMFINTKIQSLKTFNQI